MFDGTARVPMMTETCCCSTLLRFQTFGVKWNFYEPQTMTETSPCWFGFLPRQCVKSSTKKSSAMIDTHCGAFHSICMKGPGRTNLASHDMAKCCKAFFQSFRFCSSVCDNKQKLLPHSFASHKYACKSPSFWDFFLLPLIARYEDVPHDVPSTLAYKTRTRSEKFSRKIYYSNCIESA